VLTRRLSLKLLAPTVVVSLLLVATCSAGALYINHLHVDISRVSSEHFASTLAAAQLEMTVRDLRQMLEHRDAGPPGPRTKRLRQRNRQAREQLAAILELANLDQERELAGRIAAGLANYFRAWEGREGLEPGALPRYDADLAARLTEEVIPPCDKLRRYNAEQVEASEAANRRMIKRLTWGLLAAGVGAPLSGLLLGWAVARSLYQSICQLSVRIKDAAGRLNGELGPVTLEDPDDLPDLHRQMQGVVEQIERVVQRLHHSERAVLRSEQLAAVGQVAAGVAHELRNPLTSVKMLVQTGLEGPTPAGLPPEDLAIIEHEVRRMEACIQTFLDFARPPTSERRQCDLVGVVRRALTLLEGRARRQKVTWQTDLPGHPVPLLIDGEQIHQVLVNLLLNALDALPHGGVVRVEVRPPQPDLPVAAVGVRDNGPGIAPRILGRLFEPFVSGKETGLGLGLSISQRLVEAHGGTIHGANAPEGGAVFTFTLPA
jgi:signal transduction histidine kinase